LQQSLPWDFTTVKLVTGVAISTETFRVALPRRPECAPLYLLTGFLEAEVSGCIGVDEVE